MTLPITFKSAMVALVTTTVAYFTYTIYLIIHRLYFSPISKFPGPRLAAATSWYEFYFDWWLQGKFIFEIERLHKIYGPIIRINPYELSVCDPKFYNELYVTESRRRTDGYDVFCKGLDFDGSFLLTHDHDLHKKRRRPFEPFFSTKGVTGLQSIIAEVALKLESRFKELQGKHTVVRLDHAFTSFSSDVIARICLETRAESGGRFLDNPDFSPEWHDLIHMIVKQTPLFTGFPWLIKIVSIVPQGMLLWAFPQSQAFNTFTEKASRHIRKCMAEASENSSNGVSVFHNIVNGDMPTSEKTERRLTQEAQIMLAAGTVTTARTISVASYHIISKSEIRYRLEAELSSTLAGWPQTVPTWAELERLPFLQAIIKESLRISYGIMHRLPRVSPDTPLRYGEYTIPTRVPVAMSSYLMHSDPAVYSSPEKFIPERWIGDIDPALNQSWVPFCKGSRNCIGMNLAKAELSLALAVLYRPNGPKFELFETDESDVTMAHDLLIPLPKLNTKGIRALVR